jgi:hypothetical protein
LPKPPKDEGDKTPTKNEVLPKGNLTGGLNSFKFGDTVKEATKKNEQEKINDLFAPLKNNKPEEKPNTEQVEKQ